MDSNRQPGEEVREMKYLFIGAHTDDAELSCGGTMAKLVEENHNVVLIPVSHCGSDELLEEFYSAAKILGVEYSCLFWRKGFIGSEQNIANELYDIRGSYNYTFTHSPICKHSDHKIVGQQSLRIFNGNIITYLQAWNGDEDPNYFIELSEQHLEKKIQALACYKSQSHRSYMNPDFIRSQAIYNGIKCGKRYAEAFRIEKLIN